MDLSSRDTVPSIDTTPTGGSTTERYSVSGSWRHIGASAVQNATLFVIASDLTLFSDFTYFLNNPVQGDQFEQQEHRVVIGGSYTNARERPRCSAPITR